MSSILKIFLPLLTMMIAVSGCGDLQETVVQKRKLDPATEAVNCKLEMDDFSDIMTKQIPGQIDCLGKTLIYFSNIVESEKPGYLSREQLEVYLRDFSPETKPEMVKVLGSVFNIGHLITGDDPNYISQETINKVIDFAIIFNREAAVNFGPVFESDIPVSYVFHLHQRERISVSNKRIIQSFWNIFNSSRGEDEIHQLNLEDLIASFSEDDKFNKLLFLKKILLGGDEKILTHVELQKLILNFDRLLLIVLDGIRFNNIILDQESTLQLLKRDVNEFSDILHRLNGNDNTWMNTPLFTLSEAIEAAKVFIDSDSDFDISKYEVLIEEAKVILTSEDGNSTDVTGVEIQKIFDHGKSLLHTGTVFHWIYNHFKDQLNGPGPVNIDFTDYRHTYPNHEKEIEQFERIVKNYRFMKGEPISAYYTHDYKRNPEGIFQIALFEYGVNLLFKRYGKDNEGTGLGTHSMDKFNMEDLLKKFEDQLIDLKILLPQAASRTANNISLLGTLFQYQSDKNGLMDVNEAAEFGVSLFTAINISKDIASHLEKQSCTQDEYGRFDPACTRQHFLRGFCSKYRPYYPLMFEYLNAPEKCEDWENTPATDVFLDRAIVAARACNNYTDGDREEIPYSKGDFMSIMLAIIHAETTILRWDSNKNNIMDPHEVMNAYEIYSPALDGFVKGIMKPFKKQIFQFLVKYEDIPDKKNIGSILKFIKFALSSNRKREAPATRKTILSVLVAIGQQNRQQPGAVNLDCKLLRDPTNIPREPQSFLKTMDDGPDYSYLLEQHL